MQPRGKGFNLDIDARVDTGRWLEVTGTVGTGRGLVEIAGTAIATAAEPKLDAPAAEEAVPPPVRVPGTVIFSTPGDHETDVSSAASVRVQFSRGLDPKTLMGNIRVTAAGSTAPIEFQSNYDAGTNSIEIKFAKPLERFSTVKLELLEGIKMFDSAPLTPWAVTFSVGAN